MKKLSNTEAELKKKCCLLKKACRLHERALRIVYDDNILVFDQLLDTRKSFCIHHQNIANLFIEIFKALHINSRTSLK